LKALPGWLASWKLSAALLLLAALCYLFRVIWSTSAPAPPIADGDPPLICWLIYPALLLNAGFCLWRRLPLLGRDLSARPIAGRCAHRWELKVSVPMDASATTAMLRRLGYRIERCDDGSYWGLRRRWSALGSFLSHAALFPIAFGLLTTSTVRRETSARAVAGDSLTVAQQRFRVDEITPASGRDRPRVTAVQAALGSPDGGRLTAHVNRPRWLSPGTFIRLGGSGYAPRFQLINRAGRTVESAEVKLSAIPASARDSFQLQRSPHRVYVKVLAEKAEEGDLIRPALHTEVYRGSLKLAEGKLVPGVGLEFEGLTLLFSEVRCWGELIVVHDPGVPLLFFGLLLGLSGLLLRVRGRRAELLLSPPDEGGRCTLRGYGDSTLPALGVGRGGAG